MSKDADVEGLNTAVKEGLNLSSDEKKYDRWALRDESTIDYGYLAQTYGAGINRVNKETDKTFYLTTAINYTNGPAHMGHAYEGATSDVISRFQRLKGDRPCYFVTGADEHGQKIAATAEKEGKQPQEICDKVRERYSLKLFCFCILFSHKTFFVVCDTQYVTGFKTLNQRLLVSNDDYVRTTSDRHKRVARELWKRCHANGDIYLDTYAGWYNVREETFVTDLTAEMDDFKDPTTGKPLKRVEEESYLFKMSAYADKLIQHIKDNPDFIRPEQHRNNILSRLTSDPLRDLAISRTTFSWGIKVPEGFNDNHVMYVWIDALSNYLTGIDYFGTNGDNKEGIEKFWPSDVHIIGKDILWFHTVIWPCLLMSAGIPLPASVYLHGFVNDREGKKMSKSIGNVVDPHDVLDQSHVDSFRWYVFANEILWNNEKLFQLLRNRC